MKVTLQSAVEEQELYFDLHAAVCGCLVYYAIQLNVNNTQIRLPPVFEQGRLSTTLQTPFFRDQQTTESPMALLRIPFGKALNESKIPYEDRKARFGRQRFVVEGGAAQRVGYV
jgi:hypothetical protein